MTDIEPFGLVILVIGLVGTAAVLSNRLSERLRVPAPAFFLVFAASASDVFPNLARLSDGTVQRVVTVALAFILFDGGMHIGWRRFRGAALAIGGAANRSASDGHPAGPDVQPARLDPGMDTDHTGT